MDLFALAPILTAEFLYLRALGILRGRGVAVPRLQIVLWHIGVVLWMIAFVTPLDRLSEELLSAHMAQHLLIADLGAPLLIVGMRNPVLVFLLPRTLLVSFARARRLRSFFRTLRSPLVAIGVYTVVLYSWHFAFAFEGALRDPLVHAFQHACFVGAGILVWWPALEPKRRRLRGELWKIGHILGARLLGMFLGMSFVIIRTPIYADFYGPGDRGLGLAALTDQQIAGAMMVVTDILIMVFALSFFFLRAAQEDDREAQRLTRR